MNMEVRQTESTEGVEMSNTSNSNDAKKATNTLRAHDTSINSNASSANQVVDADDDLEAGVCDTPPRRVGWASLTPFLASTTKAFLGSNYLGISFGFSQSGYVLGVVGLTLITVLTVHCCFMLVECKRLVQQEHKKAREVDGESGEDLIQYGK
jgi:hypothetical protein